MSTNEDEYVEEVDEIWENQSKVIAGKAWKAPSSLSPFSDFFGKTSYSSSFNNAVPVPLYYLVTKDWAIDTSGAKYGLCDKDGWCYG